MPSRPAELRALEGLRSSRTDTRRGDRRIAQQATRALLVALGLRHVGTAAAKTLARAFGSSPRYGKRDAAAWKPSTGSGPTMSGSVAAFSRRARELPPADRFEAAGVALHEHVEGSAGPPSRRAPDRPHRLSPHPDRTGRHRTDRGGSGAPSSPSVSKKTDLVGAGADAGEKRARRNNSRCHHR